MVTIRYIIQSLVCLAEIAGIVGGVIAVTRGKKALGLLAVVGFLFLGINLLINLGLEISANYVASHFIDVYWLNGCVAAPLAFLGVISLVIAVFSGAPKDKPVA